MDQFWKLDSPKMCRDFLENLRVGKEGKKIEYVDNVADGRRVFIKNATDQEVMEIAAMVAEMIEANAEENPEQDTQT